MSDHREQIKRALSGGLLPSQTPSRGPLVTDHRIMCIYHAPCLDGFAAAWCMHHHWPKAEIELIPAKYGKNEPIPDVRNRVVYVLDFSFPREVVEKMLKEAATFLLLDHHETAMKNLIGLDCFAEGDAPTKWVPGMKFWCSDGGRINLDMSRSGAGIAWDFFSKGQSRNKLIDHIEDRDLWKFQLPGTREINAALFSYDYDMKVWDDLMKLPTKILEREGVPIERKHFKDVRELVRETQRKMFIGNCCFPVANVPYTMASDACHVMMEDGFDFAACYVDKPDGRIFSLRSNGILNVADLARTYGGGGHPKAAGMTMPLGWEGEDPSDALAGAYEEANKDG